MKPQIKLEGEFEAHKLDYCMNVSEYYCNTTIKDHMQYIWVTDLYNASKNKWTRKYRYSFLRKLLNKTNDPIIKQIMQDFDEQYPIPQPKIR